MALPTFLCGAGGGACIGLVGWGGAQVLIPGLTRFAGFSSQKAAATSLCSLSFSAVIGAASFYREGHCDVKTAAAISLPSIAGARGGLLASRRMTSDQHRLFFDSASTVLLPTHLFIQNRASTAERPKESSLAGHAAFGVFCGALSALMGVGGLPLTMSYLTLATDTPHHLVQGTAMTAVAPAVCYSAAGRFLAGEVGIRTIALAAAGSATGTAIGSQVALALSEDELRGCFMGSLVLLG
eukprot:CAMPEP_0119284926 /NCGR_PEP_ID=MMETSP1329-20130426/31262_1 /TAXON_ID=114041 /ORGANISM="Genus nov. species nov., Strain RCC1024" /LENGTH=239 /DNA_ID=CAMNT_0007285627 /DNA_START=114 /DNA_END=830 /DNA_ORIENTATION=+